MIIFFPRPNLWAWRNRIRRGMERMAAIPLLLLRLSSSSVSGLPVEGLIAAGSVPIHQGGFP